MSHIAFLSLFEVPETISLHSFKDKNCLRTWIATELSYHCEIWRSHSGIAKDSSLLVCDTFVQQHNITSEQTRIFSLPIPLFLCVACDNKLYLQDIVYFLSVFSFGV